MIGRPNLLEVEDMVKGFPDQMLFQQAQNPSGEIPQFLLVSEIQRRSNMRKDYEAQQQQPENTVAEQIMQQGIAASVPNQPQMPSMSQQNMAPMPDQMPPQGMPPQAMPPQQPMMPPMGQPQGIEALPSPEMGMAEGGIVSMFEGGDAPSIEELRKMYPEYTEEQIQTIFESKIMPDGNVFSRTLDKITGTADAFGSEYQRIQDEAEKGGFAGGAGAATIAPFRLAAKGIGALGKQAYDAPLTQLGISAVKGIPEFVGGVTGLSELSMDDLSYLPVALGADPNTVGLPDAILNRRKNLLQEINIDDITKLKSSGSEEPVIGNAGVSRKDLIAGLEADTEQMSNEAAAKTSANVQGAGREVQGKGVSSNAVEQLMNMLGQKKEVASIDDLIKDTKKEALSGALFDISEGIMGGSLAQGLSKAGRTALATKGKARALEAEQRQLEAKAKDADRTRDIGILGTLAGLEIDREKIDAEIDIAATALSRELAKQTSLDERETFRQITLLAKSLVGTMKQDLKDGKMVPTGEMYTVEEAVAAAAASLGMPAPASMGQLTGGGSGNTNKYTEYSIVR